MDFTVGASFAFSVKKAALGKCYPGPQGAGGDRNQKSAGSPFSMSYQGRSGPHLLIGQRGPKALTFSKFFLKKWSSRVISQGCRLEGTRKEATRASGSSIHRESGHNWNRSTGWRREGRDPESDPDRDPGRGPDRDPERCYRPSRLWGWRPSR